MPSCSRLVLFRLHCTRPSIGYHRGSLSPRDPPAICSALRGAPEPWPKAVEARFSGTTSPLQQEMQLSRPRDLSTDAVRSAEPISSHFRPQRRGSPCPLVVTASLLVPRCDCTLLRQFIRRSPLWYWRKLLFLDDDSQGSGGIGVQGVFSNAHMLYLLSCAFWRGRREPILMQEHQSSTASES